MIIGFRVGETEETSVVAKSVLWIEGLKSILGEDSTQSEVPKETLDFGRN